ncbi:MAG: helix-turn-helix domain-containing protein [Candidatus Levybacteria bacterium]|nr:helix-turn-helix domain-containing protein [Candidatus Levybacteria bacterium]
MDTSVIETSYPLTFRKADAVRLGEHVLHRHSVDLVGMKRVGISNFLRFFLYHKDVVNTYIGKGQKHLFIPVDLNDLIEREMYPFWALTLKRIVDVVNYSDLPGVDKKRIESLFLNSIQTHDLFLLIDGVRQALVSILATDVYPTIFFLRFDRVKDAVNQQFFDNLQGLKDATHQKLAYVFTNYRTLDYLSPAVFTKASLSVFSHLMYMKPAKEQDMRVIYQTFADRYSVHLPDETIKDLIEMAHGHVQYLQLALIILNEKKDSMPKTKNELFSLISKDERVTLQSEELWESLMKEEKEILLKTSKGNALAEQDRQRGVYLFETGFILDENGAHRIFNPIFEHYLKHREEKGTGSSAVVHFSKKEHLLMTVLEQHKDAICEREEIVDAVWPEYRELGVSDWAIDRLVARVRAKLKQQKNNLEIVTIRTRGYKLTPA